MSPRWGLAVALIAAVMAFAPTRAQDRIVIDGGLDLRLVHTDATPSYLQGGLGKLRFDDEREGLRLGRASLSGRLRMSDTTALHVVADAYGDHDRNAIDLSELWLEYRPFPTGPVRWRLKAGAFYLPVSLEHRGIGWTDVYTLTPSALNAWAGEELRTLGTELEARWLGSSRGYLGDVALVAAAYGWNDPAGALIADRGFALTDRPSTLFGGLSRPAIGFYHEIDRKPGYYAGLVWRHHDRLEVRALRYDNRGDPGAVTAAGGGAWRTRFSSVGARLEPTAHWTFIVQALDGDTTIGADDEPEDQFVQRFRASFALASVVAGRHRVSVRFDDFHTHQRSGFYGPPSDDAGHAWTVGATRTLSEDWEVLAEWLRVSSRFPPRRHMGLAPDQRETQFQLALRYRLHVGD